MEAMERFWQTLFKKKKKKKNDNTASDEAVNKENIHEEPEKVTVKTTGNDQLKLRDSKSIQFSLKLSETVKHFPGYNLTNSLR